MEDAIREGIRGRLMWYSLKCNRLELLPLRQYGDVRKLMKGNDGYAYLIWQGVKVHVWDGYMGMKYVKGSQGEWL